MNSFTKVIAVIILAVMLFCVIGCAKTDYMSWTHEDWIKADEKDRIRCSKEYTLAVKGESSARTARANAVLIEAGLTANPGFTVKELADLAKSIG